MTYDPAIHDRHFPRMKHYDYSQSGIYFITICTYNRETMFGEVIEDTMCLNSTGEIAKAMWNDTCDIFPGVELDLYVFMPNHFHGLVGFTDTLPPDALTHKHLLGEVVRKFKTRTSYYVHASGTRDFRWQYKYWDSIVRNERQLNAIRQYIINNPAKWTLDKLYV